MGTLIALAVIATPATAVVRAAGVVGMMRGGAFDRRRGSRLMVARIGAQTSAFVLLLTAIALTALRA